MAFNNPMNGETLCADSVVAEELGLPAKCDYIFMQTFTVYNYIYIHEISQHQFQVVLMSLKFSS